MPADCSHCGAASATARCSACLETVYCSKECQKAHWRAGHKAACHASQAALQAFSAPLQAQAAVKEAAASALTVPELLAALRARGIPTAGLLEKAELVQALVCAPLLPQAAQPAGQSEAEQDAVAQQDMARLMEAAQMGAGRRQGTVSYESLIGAEATARIAAAQQRAATRGAAAGGGGGGSAGGRGGSSRASAAPSGVAVLTGSGLVPMDMDMSSPLTRAELLELCRRKGKNSPTPGDAMTYGMLSMRLLASAGGDQAVADTAVASIKGMPEHLQDSLLDKLLDAQGTTQGLKARLIELMRVAAGPAGKKAGH